MRSLLAYAKKVVGLKPIGKVHVGYSKRGLGELEGETEEEKEDRAKEDAVKMYLQHEMKMKKVDIEQLVIVKMFFPAKEDSNTLYVELATSEQAQFLMSFTSNMKRGTSGEDRLEVIKYIPKDLFNRFKAISALGNKARVESQRTISFRVSFGQDDFILQQKPRGSRGWGLSLPLPAGLPPFERHLRKRAPRSPGEAPGRPAMTPGQGQDRKRGREVRSPTGSTPPFKKTAEEILAATSLVGSPTITPPRPGQGLLAAAAVPDYGNMTVDNFRTPTKPNTRSNKNKGE